MDNKQYEEITSRLNDISAKIEDIEYKLKNGYDFRQYGRECYRDRFVYDDHASLPINNLGSYYFRDIDLSRTGVNAPTGPLNIVTDAREPRVYSDGSIRWYNNGQEIKKDQDGTMWVYANYVAGQKGPSGIVEWKEIRKEYYADYGIKE